LALAYQKIKLPIERSAGATAPYNACHPLKNSTNIMFPVSNTAYLHYGA
jgi:hypothetical protein